MFDPSEVEAQQHCNDPFRKFQIIMHLDLTVEEAPLSHRLAELQKKIRHERDVDEPGEELKKEAEKGHSPLNGREDADEKSAEMKEVKKGGKHKDEEDKKSKHGHDEKAPQTSPQLYTDPYQ